MHTGRVSKRKIRRKELDELLRVRYWRQQTEKAKEEGRREAKRLQGELEEAETRMVFLQAELAGERRKNEELTARVAYLQGELFGGRTEGSKEKGKETLEKQEGTGRKRRGKRGRRKGSKGHGRRRRESLETEERIHELPEDQACCQVCGEPYTEFGVTEDSEEIHWEVRVVRHVHRRKKYRRRCKCQQAPMILRAPVPPKLIPKGLFSVEFWVEVLMGKYHYQQPVHRLCQQLAQEGLEVSAGTLTGGMKRLLNLLEPVYEGILEQSRQAHHWQMDETRWQVFEEIEGKKGYRWWLWVVVNAETCCYLIEPSRSGKIPKQHLGENPQGILNVDRYSGYKGLGEGVLLAFCWSHIRRDFLRVRDGYPRLKEWGQGWVDRIDRLFRANRERREALGDEIAFDQADEEVRSQVKAMKEKWQEELRKKGLHEAQRKALQSLKWHWKGALVFVENPTIPMDNNESERRLRPPVVGRKNYYGSGSVWSGQLAAMMFTILQTVSLHEMNPKEYLRMYLQACAENGGRAPEDVESYLPWNMTEEKQQVCEYPRGRSP